MQTLRSQNVSLILMKRVQACCVSATLFAVLAGAAPVCAPPTPPYLPENDETLKEYADLINEDFERYFSEISEYSSCLDHARAELLTEAQAVSQLHGEFLARVEALGIQGKAATNPSTP